MAQPSAQRKYYVVNTRPAYDGFEPDIDGLVGWTARYLSESVAVVRDPLGSKDFPLITEDTVIPDDLPVMLDLSMTQADADTMCDKHGLARVDLVEFSTDRVGGV